MVYELNKDYSTALFYYQKSLEICRKTENQWKGIALCYEKLNEYELAVKAYEKIFWLNKSSKEDIFIMLSYAYCLNKLDQRKSLEVYLNIFNNFSEEIKVLPNSLFEIIIENVNSYYRETKQYSKILEIDAIMKIKSI